MQQGEPVESRYEITAQQPAGATTLSTLCVKANDISGEEPVTERDTPFDSDASKASLRSFPADSLCEVYMLCSKFLKMGNGRHIGRQRLLLTDSQPTHES